ncbi:Calcium-dependent protein kinase 4 [Haplosporangium bisporale]|nr:Calcium-dependent protein kinase 4 [Haplosporangium bisporale]KAF9217428.1 Calcium-dependent protein kinase 4 [Podila verticillata]KFH64159.1 serine/threonine protein kinase [Podila verticillata NRRL 6337]
MATISLATTTTYSPSAKYDLITLTPIPTSSRSDNGGHTRSSLHLHASPDKGKRCFSMSFNPTSASVTKSKPTSSSPQDQKSHRTSINFFSPVPQRRQHRTTYGQNLPSLPLIKTNTHRHITKNGHKKMHSIQLGKLTNNLSSHALVQSPLQQSHVIDWTVGAQAREIETEPESPSCATCEDYVYMAPCEHHPSKGQTEYLINDIFPKLTHDLSTIEFGIRISDFMPLAFKTVPVVGLAEKELQLLHGLSDLPNVIHLQDSFVNDNGDTVLVLPMLKKFDCQAVNSSLCTVRKSIRQILTGLAAVHAKNIVHLDINPSNLMTTHDKKDIVVIDFGLSMTVDRSGQATKVPVCGTHGYIAPEVMHSSYYERHDPTLADLYSLGIVLGEMLEPYIPDCDLHYFGSKHLTVENTNQTVELLKEFIAQGASYPRVLIQAADLLRIMLQEDPNDRKSAKDLLKSHPFLATSPVQWATLKLCDWLCRVQDIKYHKYLYQEQNDCDVVRYR